MRRLETLHKVNRFLRNLDIPDIGCEFHYVTSQADATTTLDKLRGIQVLKARPELNQYGEDTDTYESTIDTVIFVLDKALEAGRTQEKEDAQFYAIEVVADKILHKIDDALTSGDCNSLTGITLSNLTVTPEVQIFGSWLGLSLAITFKK